MTVVTISGVVSKKCALLAYLRNAIALVVIAAFDPDNASLQVLCEQLQNGSPVYFAVYHLHTKQLVWQILRCWQGRRSCHDYRCSWL